MSLNSGDITFTAAVDKHIHLYLPLNYTITRSECRKRVKINRTKNKRTQQIIGIHTACTVLTPISLSALPTYFLLSHFKRAVSLEFGLVFQTVPVT